MKILFACSEYFPLTRTNDVADFAAGLTGTIGQLSHDIRVIMPAYPEAVNAARPLETLTTLEFAGCDETIRLLKGKIAGQTFPVYLVDAPGLFARHGHPYKDAKGSLRRDNLKRFALFSQAVSMIALNHAGLSWRPDIVHCNDWQTGLIPALLAQDWNRPATVFSNHQISTIEAHALAELDELKLPAVIKHSANCQIGGLFSTLKAGISYSDVVVSSSETFASRYESLPIADELKSAFRKLGDRFIGIQPALDENRWSPVNDEYIQQPFDTATFELKSRNKLALQQRFKLPETAAPITITVFDEITEFRDNDELIQSVVLQDLLQEENCQLILCCDTLKPGPILNNLAQSYPQQVSICLQPDEEDLHYLVAGSDAAVFSNEKRLTRLLPDACWHYGTATVLGNTLESHVGIIDATSENLMRNTANAFMYKNTLVGEMLPTMQRMTRYYHRTGPWWKKLAINIMDQAAIKPQAAIQSAHQYLECYQFAIDNPASNPDQN